MNIKMLIPLIVVFLIGGAFSLFERSGRFHARTVSIIATTSALAGAFRIPFAFLPNVQPTTFIIMCAGYVFGPMSGFISGAIATLVSNTFLGHGPWTLWQMIAWGLAGAFGGLLGKLSHKYNRLGFTLILFIWGFLFDYIMNLWHFIYFIYPHSLKSFVALYAASFFFDLSHGVGNAIFAWLFGEDLIRILKRFKLKTTIEDKDFERTFGYE